MTSRRNGASAGMSIDRASHCRAANGDNGVHAVNTVSNGKGRKGLPRAVAICGGLIFLLAVAAAKATLDYVHAPVHNAAKDSISANAETTSTLSPGVKAIAKSAYAKLIEERLKAFEKSVKEGRVEELILSTVSFTRDRDNKRSERFSTDFDVLEKNALTSTMRWERVEGNPAGTGRNAKLCVDINEVLKTPMARTKNSKQKKMKVRKCFPNFIIAGAQKGGTTTLQTILSFHPKLRTSKRKEVHFWDFETTYRRKSYLETYFRPDTSGVIHFDATPSYSAGIRSCERISKHLPSSTKLVIILRDPVERLWSEYRMKERRVHNQNACGEHLLAHLDDFEACAHKLPKNATLSYVNACLRNTLRVPQCSKGKMIGMNFWRLGFKNKTRLFSVIEDCRQSTIEKRIGECDRLTAMREFMPSYDKIFGDSVKLEKCSSKWERNATWTFGSDGLLNCKRENVEVSTDPPRVGTKSICMEGLRDMCPHCYSSSSELKPCLRTCLKPKCERGFTRVNSFECSYPELWCGSRKPSRCSPSDVWCECASHSKKIASLSRDYFWRGYYTAQLERCFHYINRDRILIVDNQELRQAPQQTINAILRHIDAPSMDVSNITADDIKNRLDSLYPEFERISGWAQAVQPKQRCRLNSESALARRTATKMKDCFGS